jgi:hypothetical protein
MKSVLLAFLIFFSTSLFGQFSSLFGEMKKYNQDINLYESKRYIIDSIYGRSKSPIYIEIDAMTAARSGELTTLVHSCDSMKKKGVVFSFWGEYWNKYGVDFKGYKYKQFSFDQTLTLLNLIFSESEKFKTRKYKNFEDKKFLQMIDGGETYFDFLDMTILLTGNREGVSNVRIFWGDFDATWELVSMEKTKKRLLEKQKMLNY